MLWVGWILLVIKDLALELNCKRIHHLLVDVQNLLLVVDFLVGLLFIIHVFFVVEKPLVEFLQLSSLLIVDLLVQERTFVAQNVRFHVFWVIQTAISFQDASNLQELFDFVSIQIGKSSADGVNEVEDLAHDVSCRSLLNLNHGQQVVWKECTRLRQDTHFLGVLLVDLVEDRLNLLRLS